MTPQQTPGQPPQHGPGPGTWDPSQPFPLQYTDGGRYAPVVSHPPRPTSVTVIAWIGIVLGGLGLICKPTSLIFFVVKLRVPNPVVDAMKNDSFIRGWMVISVATGWLLSLLLLMSSIGSLRLRDWGRVGMLAYAGLALVMTIVSQAIGVLAISPALAPAMREAAAQQPSAFQMSPMAGAVMGVVLGLWFPLLILYYFNRRPAKEAFRLDATPTAPGVS